MDELFTRYMYFVRAKMGIKSSTTEALRKFYEKDNYALLKKDSTFNDMITLAHFWEDVSNQDRDRFSPRILHRLFVLNYAPNGMWTYFVSVYFMKNKDANGMLDDDAFYQFLNRITGFIWTYAVTNPGVNALRTPVYAEMVNIVNNRPVSFDGFKFEPATVKSMFANFTFSNTRPITKSMLAWWAFQDDLQELISLETVLEIEHIYARNRFDKDKSLSDVKNLEAIGNKALLEKRINIRAADYRFSDKIKYNEVLPNVFFTHFLLFNKEVEVGEVYGNKVILDKALNFVDQVELDYKQNMFCVQFASDNYIIPEKVEYAYKLEGFGDEWITTKTGEAVYTNLFPGTYLLRVKAINSDGFSGNEEASLKIVVTPPFWLSTWACILYVILFVGIMLLMCSKMCGGKRKSGQSEEQSEIGEDESDEESEELEQPGSYKPEEKVTSEEESGAVLLAHDESISSEVVDEVVSKAVEEEEVVEIKTIESVLEEKKEIDTVSTIKTQRARVIQLIEDENSDEYTTYIVPEDELPEVIITAGSKKVDGIIPPAISEMIGTKKAVSHSGNDESVDEKLLGAAMKYVESNISRSDLSVEELSRELGMSRVNLYKRLVAMTGKTPIEFIRVIRLKHAAKLLRETRMNISEVAYQVGFNNPKYFTKYFKEEFGMLPSVYQEKEKQEQGE